MNWELEKRGLRGGGRGQGDNKWHTYPRACGLHGVVCALWGRVPSPMIRSLIQQIFMQLTFCARCRKYSRKQKSTFPALVEWTF